MCLCVPVSQIQTAPPVWCIDFSFKKWPKIAHTAKCAVEMCQSVCMRARRLLLSAMLNKILYIKITRTVKMAVGQFRGVYMQICCTSKHFAFIMNNFDSSVSRCNKFINGLLCSLRPVALENWNVFLEYRKVPYCYLHFVFAFPFLWVDLNSDRVHTILINQKFQMWNH